MRRLFLIFLLLYFTPLAQADLLSFGNKKPSFLPADKAFMLEVHAIDQHTLIASFKVTPDYYLYRNKISFNVANDKFHIARVDLPKGEPKEDPNFGTLEVFHQSFQAQIVLDKVDAAKPLALNASYQGCSDKGLCYPPIEKTFNIEFVQTLSTSPSPVTVSADLKNLPENLVYEWLFQDIACLHKLIYQYKLNIPILPKE